MLSYYDFKNNRRKILMCKKIYLGIPYTGMEEKSFSTVNRVAAQLMKKGHIVFSPISQNHPIAMQEGLPTEWSFWKKFDIEFLKWCDALYVIKFPGWKRSKGLLAEMNLATDYGKEQVFMEINENGEISECTG